MRPALGVSLDWRGQAPCGEEAGLAFIQWWGAATDAASPSKLGKAFDSRVKLFRGSQRRKQESMNDYIVRKVELYTRARQALARVIPHYERQRHRHYDHGHQGWHRWWTYDDCDRRSQDASHEQQANSSEGTGDPAEALSPMELQLGIQLEPVLEQEQLDTCFTGAESAPELMPEFFQGWYLLNDSGVSNSEKNMIQTAIGEHFNVQRVAQELRNQWSDEDVRRRDQTSRPVAYWQDEETKEEDETTPWTADALQAEGMTSDGIALMTEEEVKCEEALALIHQAKRTLREAREVKLSRQYYKVGTTTARENVKGISCFRCGGPHDECPDRHAPKPGASTAKPHVAEEAPFFCHHGLASRWSSSSGGHSGEAFVRLRQLKS